MARVSVSLFGVFMTAISLGVPARGAVAAPAPPQDFVAGSGEAGMFHEVSVDAHSDPLGGNASGTVSFVIEVDFFWPLAPGEGPGCRDLSRSRGTPRRHRLHLVHRPDEGCCG
jgi:hypothetical protein